MRRCRRTRRKEDDRDVFGFYQHRMDWGSRPVPRLCALLFIDSVPRNGPGFHLGHFLVFLLFPDAPFDVHEFPHATSLTQLNCIVIVHIFFDFQPVDLPASPKPLPPLTKLCFSRFDISSQCQILLPQLLRHQQRPKPFWRFSTFDLSRLLTLHLWSILLNSTWNVHVVQFQTPNPTVNPGLNQKCPYSLLPSLWLAQRVRSSPSTPIPTMATIMHRQKESEVDLQSVNYRSRSSPNR